MDKPQLHVYEIDDGETHWYVASSSRGALLAYAKNQVYPPKNALSFLRDHPEITAVECDDNKKMSITSRAEDTGAKKDETITQTFRKWAKEWPAGECIATTNV